MNNASELIIKNLVWFFLPFLLGAGVSCHRGRNQLRRSHRPETKWTAQYKPQENVRRCTATASKPRLINAKGTKAQYLYVYMHLYNAFSPCLNLSMLWNVDALGLFHFGTEKKNIEFKLLKKNIPANNSSLLNIVLRHPSSPENRRHIAPTQIQITANPKAVRTWTVRSVSTPIPKIRRRMWSVKKNTIAVVKYSSANCVWDIR